MKHFLLLITFFYLYNLNISQNCLAGTGLTIDQNYIDNYGNNITISENIKGDNKGTGIYLKSLQNVNISNSSHEISSSSTGGRGISISEVSNSTIINNQGGVIQSIGETSEGIYIYKSNNNIIENSHENSAIYSNGTEVIDISSSSNNIVYNSGSIINNGTKSGSSAFYISGTASNLNYANTIQNDGIISASPSSYTSFEINNYVDGLNINNDGIINGDIISKKNGNQVNFNNRGIVNGDIALKEGNHNINIYDGIINGRLDLGVGTNINISANENQTIIIKGREDNVILATNNIIKINGQGSVIFEGNVVDSSEDNNDLLLSLSGSSNLQFSNNSFIDGSLNSSNEFNIIDIKKNILTIKGDSIIDSDTTIILDIHEDSHGQLMTQGEEINILLSENVIIRTEISKKIPQNGEIFTIIQNQSLAINQNPDSILLDVQIKDPEFIDISKYDFVLENDNYNLNFVIRRKLRQSAGLTGDDKIINDILDQALKNDEELLLALNDIRSVDILKKSIKELKPKLTNATIGGAELSFNNSIKTVSNRISSHLNPDMSGVSTGNKYKNISTWGQIFGQNAKQDGSSQEDGYKIKNSGFTFGFDKEFMAKKLMAGLSFSHSNSEVKNDSFDTTNIESFQTNIYGSYALKKGYFIDGSISYSHNINKSLRNININPINRTATAKYNSYQYGLTVNGNKNYQFNKFIIKPNLSLQYVNLDVESYQENGAGASSLISYKQNYDNLYGSIDNQISKKFSFKNLTISPRINVGYKYRILGDQPVTKSKLAGGGTIFSNKSAKTAKHSIIAGTGLVIKKEDLSLNISYESERKNDYSSHYGAINIRYDF